MGQFIPPISLVQIHKSCREYFLGYYQGNKFLYIDDIPHQFMGKEFIITPMDCEYTWLNEPLFEMKFYEGQDINYGRRLFTFDQVCHIQYSQKLNSLIVSNKKNQEIEFHLESYEPFDMYQITLKIKEIDTLIQNNKIRSEIRHKFKIKSMDEEIGFEFYTGILRKSRNSKPIHNELLDDFVYHEISNCHNEIQHCLLHALFHERYTSDLMGKKIVHESKVYYRPNISYNDLEYLMFVSSGMDRLYSFWDRIAFLLANFDNLGMNLGSLTFDKYIKRLGNIALSTPTKYDRNSPHLKVLYSFVNNEYQTLLKYRHRIVHYRITERREGVLTAKFMTNTFASTASEEEIKKLKYEFEGLGELLLNQFNKCALGFRVALNLINELN